MSKYQAGFDDGSAPDHVVQIGGDAVAVTNWGCDCCKMPTDEDEVAMAHRIAACLTACDGLNPAAIPSLVEAVSNAVKALTYGYSQSTLDTVLSDLRTNLAFVTGDGKGGAK